MLYIPLRGVKDYEKKHVTMSFHFRNLGEFREA